MHVNLVDFSVSDINSRFLLGYEILDSCKSVHTKQWMPLNCDSNIEFQKKQFAIFAICYCSFQFKW